MMDARMAGKGDLLLLTEWQECALCGVESVLPLRCEHVPE